MSELSRRLQWVVWTGLILVIAAVFALYLRQQPVLQSEFRATSEAASRLDVLFPIPDFTLTNQQGSAVSLADLRGKLWLVDIIFTRCAGPCPEMTRRMSELQTAVAPDAPVRFISLTTDPGHDTPPVLEAYARRFGSQPGRWHFLTGSKQQIFDLAVHGLKLTALDKNVTEQKDPNDLFVHSTIFILIDGQGRARGVFESDDPGFKPKVLAALKVLQQELPTR